MKKVLLIITLIFSLLLVSCNTNDTDNNGNDGNNNGNEEIDNYFVDYATEQLIKLNDTLRLPSSNALFPDMLQHVEGRGVANLWDFSAYFTAVIRAYKVNPTSEVKAYYDQAMRDLGWYESTNRDDNHLVYASNNGRETPAFYDDNVWLVIGLLDAYEMTNDNELLEMAESVQAWIYESWQTAFGGGLLWREFGPGTDPAEISRNTCINAPAAYAAARFYQLTESQDHLNWAKRIFKWTKDYLFDSTLNVYLDNINQLGQVNSMIFTYNTGVMISAAALLYHITDDVAYQEHALLLIDGGQQILSKKHINPTIEGDFYKDNTWFNLYIYQGYLDATRYLDDTELAHKNMRGAIQSFNFSYPKYKDHNGLALEKWDATGYTQAQSSDFKAATLYASGTLESIGIFAEYFNENSDLFK